ncbi:MAG TPA: hypothetical protein VFU89_08760 [Rhabdochlamydiaceae bacterium]|nr:hypothetical protein [Rhabdochlamydiaceae bacterium]
MAPKTVRNRRTKSEIQQEFEAIAEEAEKDKALVSSRETIAHQMQEAAIRHAVSDITVEAIIRKMSDLGSEISKALGNLSDKLVGEVHLLHQVKNAIIIENEHLQKLHKIDVTAAALDQLIENYQQKKMELELEISSMREELEKERARKEEETVESEKNLKTARLREKEEYEYQLKIERKKAQDQYEEERAAQERSNREKQDTFEKTWQQREEGLKARENHLQELQKTVDAFPSRLQETIDKTRDEAIAQTEQRFSQQLLVLQKDRETEQRLAEMKIRSLEENAIRQQEHIKRLEQQVDEAKREVKQIAEKAIEGASGAKTLSHINQIAMEQAKNRSSSS